MTRFTLPFLCGSLLVSLSYADSFTVVTTRPLGVTIDWGQLGSAGTFGIPSPQSWTGSDATTGTVDDVTVFARLDQGNGWDGNFTTGDHVLWNSGVFGGLHPITVHFDSPITLGGAQIQSNIYGVFDGCIEALGSFGSSGVFCNTAGDSTAAADGSAIFIGIQDDTGANITDLIFSTRQPGHNNDLAINTVTYSGVGVAPVPEPSSVLLFSTALGGALLAMRRLRATRT